MEDDGKTFLFLGWSEFDRFEWRRRSPFDCGPDNDIGIEAPLRGLSRRLSHVNSFRQPNAKMISVGNDSAPLRASPVAENFL